MSTTMGRNEYAAESTYGLLQSAARGLIGIDQRFIHALVDEPSKTLPDLLRFAGEERAGDAVILQPDLVAMFRYLKTPEALPCYIRWLRDSAEEEELDDDLIEAVVEQGAAALEPLLQLYHELGEEGGDDVAFALAHLGIRDQRIFDLLLERLEYDALEGAMCLAVYGDPAALPALERMLRSVPETESGVRAELASAIDDLQKHTVDHSHPDFDLFGRYPEEAGPDFDALGETDRLELLASDSPATRADAARSFVQEPLSPEARARLLQVAREDPEPEVRGVAWEALAGDEDPGLRAVVKKVALDPSVPVAERGGALIALAGDAADTPVIHAAIESLYAEPGGRAKALEAMWRSFDRTFSRYFPPHLEDPDRDILVQAIIGAGYLGVGSQAERLARYFDHEDLRHDALFAYALCVPAEISRGRIRGLFRKIDRLGGGLSLGESELVQTALDQRLMLNGMDPVFFEQEEDEGHVHGPDCGHDHSVEDWGESEAPSLLVGASPAAPAATSGKVGRNDPCPCGSGKKYKKCCGA
jgi:hypothetical protein